MTQNSSAQKDLKDSLELWTSDWWPKDWSSDGEDIAVDGIQYALLALGHEEGQTLDERCFIEYNLLANASLLEELLIAGYELRLLRPCRLNGVFFPPEYATYGIFALKGEDVFALKLEVDVQYNDLQEEPEVDPKQ